MKKFKIILTAAILILGTFSAQAGEKTNPESNTKTEAILNLDTSTEYQTSKVANRVPEGIKKAVISELSYPSYAQNKNIEGQVYLRICVDNKSQLKIVEMNATTPYLGEYVTKQLASTYVKKPGCKAGQVYMMKVNFDLLK